LKIYLAGVWTNRAEMPAYAKTLENLGHEITHKWWLTEAGPYETRTLESKQANALLDVNGVVEADLLLLINSAKSEGKAVEQGIAIGLGIPIIAVGTPGEHSKNIFHFLNCYEWVATFNEALPFIAEVEDELNNFPMTI
jgi:nucleoside 2-deoxyribosyltransferase